MTFNLKLATTKLINNNKFAINKQQTCYQKTTNLPSTNNKLAINKQQICHHHRHEELMKVGFAYGEKIFTDEWSKDFWDKLRLQLYKPVLSSSPESNNPLNNVNNDVGAAAASGVSVNNWK